MQPGRLRRRAFSIALAIAGLTCAPRALALDPTMELPQLVHDVWQIEDGLPQNSVHDVEQDSDGYLWLATLEGLVRFDGAQFTVFNKASTEAIRSNEMRAFHLDGRGVLWVGSYGGGLIRIENGEFTALGREEGLEETRVWDVAGSEAAGLWLATHSGLYHFDGTAFRRFTAEDGLAGDDVRCVWADEDGRVWAGTMNGLSLLEKGRFRTFTTRDGLAHDKVRSLGRDRRGRLWVGTQAGLSVLEDRSFSSYTTEDGLAHDSVNAIFEDGVGAVWFGTEGGVSRLHDGHFSSFTADHGLSQGIVRSFFEDREGSLWIGTESGGLNRLREGKFTAHTRHSGLSVDLVWSFEETRDGRLWIGSADGLFLHERGRFRRFRREEGATTNWISAMHEGRDGTLWVGTNGDGLFVFRDGTFRSFPGQAELARDFILSLNEDEEGSLWIGTRNGLRRLQNGEVSSFSSKDGLAGDTVRHIEPARGGGLWIGTGTGLSHYRDGAFRNYTTEDGLSNDAVFTIHTDADGTLWLGTYGGGLNRFRDGIFHHATSRHGLYDDVIYVILEDDDGNLWMTGNKGISRVAKSDFEALAAGRAVAVPSPHYGVADGMKTRECNGGLQAAGCRTRDGRMWFPTIRGAVSIDPGDIRINTVLPPVHVTRLIADGRESELEEPLELGPGAENLEIHYTAPSFGVPKKVLFRYRLEGYDTDWVEAGTRRVAYYTNLAPGAYRFRVKACNDEGLWNKEGASFAFRKEPFFYQSAWFRIVALGSFVLVLLSYYRVRIRGMERRERRLEALVTLRTEELKEASLRDSLTGLRNRRFLNEVVKPDAAVFTERKGYLLNHEGPRQAHPMESYQGLLIVDIDHFKGINDTLGHEAGDRILEQFSEVLRRAVRKDDVVVRWGGEEFLVVLRHTTFEFIGVFAERLRSAVERTHFVAGGDPSREVRLTCSIGHIAFPLYETAPELLTLDQAITLADFGLYYAKRHGRNQAVGILPADRVPGREDIPRLLVSLEHGTNKGFLRVSPGPPRAARPLDRLSEKRAPVS